mmetsp:Transcript_17192/g.36980  ORF Transcript_17192/g.36980 Transcript_17192/m.36980 type:complete len:350 (+) Transcript_17192:313-1362(+)
MRAFRKSVRTFTTPNSQQQPVREEERTTSPAAEAGNVEQCSPREEAAFTETLPDSAPQAAEEIHHEDLPEARDRPTEEAEQEHVPNSAEPPTEESQTCSICFCEFEGLNAVSLQDAAADNSLPQDVTVRLPCVGGHLYHKGCIVRWLESHRTCPLCRSEVGSSSRGASNRSWHDGTVFDEDGVFLNTPANQRLLYGLRFALDMTMWNIDLWFPAVWNCCEVGFSSIADVCSDVLVGMGDGLAAAASGCAAGISSAYNSVFGPSKHHHAKAAVAKASGGTGAHQMASGSASGKAPLSLAGKTALAVRHSLPVVSATFVHGFGAGMGAAAGTAGVGCFVGCYAVSRQSRGR